MVLPTICLILTQYWSVRFVIVSGYQFVAIFLKSVAKSPQSIVIYILGKVKMLL